MNKILAKIRPLIASPLTFLFIAGLYPVIFLVSKNWFIYETKQLLFLLVVPVITLAIGLLLLLVFWLKEKYLQNPFPKFLIPRFFTKLCGIVLKYERLIGLKNIVLSATGFYVLYFLLDASFGKTDLIRYGFIALALLATALIRKKGFYFVNIALLLMTIMAFAELTYSLSTKSISGNVMGKNIDKAHDSSIKFITKPNIYLVHLESYHSPTAMKYLYNFDNNEFVTNLTNLGFFVSQNNFSNYDGTLSSTASIFLQQHDYYKLANGLNDAVGVRDMVGGRLYNPVLAVLKNNGYKLEFIHYDSYNFFGSDYLDYQYPPNNIHDAFLVFQNTQINMWRAKIFRMRKPQRRVAELRSEDKDNFKQILWNVLDTKRQENTPYFYYIKFSGAEHTPSDNTYNWTNSEGKWLAKYRKIVTDNNPEMLEMVNKIIKNDPTAIIIMYGDHGATRYRSILLGEKKPVDANQLIYDRRKITGYDLALDMFGVFVAVRYPGGDNKMLDGETHVNLFRIIFSALTGDMTLLEDKVANESYMKYQGKLLLLVKDGKIFEKIPLIDIPK